MNSHHAHYSLNEFWSVCGLWIGALLGAPNIYTVVHYLHLNSNQRV